jgi:hypothetical protein
MSKKTRLKVDAGPIQIDTRLVATSIEGQTAKYLNSGEVELRWAIVHSLKNTFGPLAAAIEGASPEKVDDLILSSRRACEALYQQARDQVGGRVVAEPISKEPEPIANDEDEDLSNYFGD